MAARGRVDDDEYTDDGSYADDDPNADPPEVVAKRQLKCLNMLLFVFGAAMCAFAYYVTVTALVNNFMAYTVAALGLFIAMMSCLGCCGAVAGHHKTLLLVRARPVRCTPCLGDACDWALPGLRALCLPPHTALRPAHTAHCSTTRAYC